MRHLVNGETTARALALADISGDIRSVDDILMEGPAPRRPENPGDLAVRAEFLERYLGIPHAEYMARFRERNDLLTGSCAEDETVLWFEEDVFCQVNFLDALSRLAQSDVSASRLTFVRPPDERLGALSPERLGELFKERKPVTPGLLRFASDTWDLYADPDPHGLAALVKSGDFAPWPLLRKGMAAHLARLPDPRAGLGALERVILEAVDAGAADFDEVFAAVQSQARIYGVGDRQVMRYLLDLADSAAALVTIEAGTDARPGLDARSWQGAKLGVTPLGWQVLAGEFDYMTAVRVDRWVGGTHVDAACPWRWDEGSGLIEVPKLQSWRSAGTS